MRVASRGKLRQLLGPAGRQRHDLGDAQIAEDTMMRLAASFPEQAEEQEHVAGADALVSEVRLGSVALPEQAGAVRQEHGIMVAEAVRIVPASAGMLDMPAQFQRAISGLRCGKARDRQGHRPAVDDRRWPAACRAVEPLSAEDDAHDRKTASVIGPIKARFAPALHRR
jgi:hypothetical protein